MFHDPTVQIGLIVLAAITLVVIFRGDLTAHRPQLWLRPMFHDPTVQIGLIVLAAITLVVIFRGDLTLRIATGALVLNVVACELAEDWNGLHKAQPVIFGIDIAYSVLLLALVARTRTRWPQVAAVSQVLIVATHLGGLIGPQITRWDFFTLYYVLSYVVLAALLYGALAESPVRPRVRRQSA